LLFWFLIAENLANNICLWTIGRTEEEEDESLGLAEMKYKEVNHRRHEIGGFSHEQKSF
jgi:hypothetical protein